jgi:hypothetical protein
LHSITNDITNADFRAVGPIGLLIINNWTLVSTIINNQDKIMIIYNTKNTSIIDNQRLIINNRTKIWNIYNKKRGEVGQIWHPFPSIINSPFPFIMLNRIMIIYNPNSRKRV